MSIKITVPGRELWDEGTEQFRHDPSTVLTLEHSLVSLSKWESFHKKAFLGPDKKTPEETFAYIRMMCLDEDVPEEVFHRLTNENIVEINAYIENTMTATTFREEPARGGREIITNEIIRNWMLSFNIPLEYENRHLNQLFTLIKVANEKNKPQKKVGRADLAARNRALNEARQKQYGTSG